MERFRLAVIANAIIWAAVILASSAILRDHGLFGEMLPILGGGAAASLIVVGGALRRR